MPLRRVRDMNQACYAGIHLNMYMPVGIVCALLLCLLPPLAAVLLVYRKRRMLTDPYTAQLYGFLYHKYRWGITKQAFFARGLWFVEPLYGCSAAHCGSSTATVLTQPAPHASE
jgi:hypothetical protein